MGKHQKQTNNKEGKDNDDNLSVLSQYLMIIVPFICKLVFETVQNLKHISNDAAYKYAKKNGFWDDDQDYLKKCFNKTKKKDFKMLSTNGSNNCNLENDLLNSYMDKIFKIGKKIQHTVPDKVNSLKEFEFEAIIDIMENLSEGKLDIAFLNNHLTSHSSVEKFIESWARQLKNEYNQKNIMKFDRNIYDNPCLYIDGLFSNDHIKQQKFKQCIQVLKKNLLYAEKNTKFKNAVKSLIGDTEENTIQNVLKYIENRNLVMPPDSCILNNKKQKKHVNSKSKRFKDFITKRFDKKLKLRQNDLMNLCDEAFRDESFLFPRLTLLNKNKILTEIPQWEIEKLFKKYIGVSGIKVDSE